jgi:hypothetical protein
MGSRAVLGQGARSAKVRKEAADRLHGEAGDQEDSGESIGAGGSSSDASAGVGGMEASEDRVGDWMATYKQRRTKDDPKKIIVSAMKEEAGVLGDGAGL